MRFQYDWKALPPAYKVSGTLLDAEKNKDESSLFREEHGLTEETFMYIAK